MEQNRLPHNAKHNIGILSNLHRALGKLGSLGNEGIALAKGSVELKRVNFYSNKPTTVH